MGIGGGLPIMGMWGGLPIMGLTVAFPVFTAMDADYRSRLSPVKAIQKKKNPGARFIPFRLEDQEAIYELASPGGKESTYEKILRNEVISSSTGRNSILCYTEPKNDHISSFSISPIGDKSRKLLSRPEPSIRKISRTPFKILDAPSIQDDFYLNLIDWSSKNILAVGLQSSVYLWNASTNRVNKLCDLGERNVTSISWMERGTHLAIGTFKGSIEIWDVAAQKITRTYDNHRTRVGAVDWTSNILSSGSRDRCIYNCDVRDESPFSVKLKGHKQEVCGITWSPDGKNLASGGNDNKLLVWDSRRSEDPLWIYGDHQAAVKALAWSPHQRGLLVSGGGTADRTIRFRNTLNGTTSSFLDTGSQVCNLVWSKTVNELVSTHGYSQNQIVVWKYPTMTPLATLTGHTTRVLYLSMSPDGSTIVTGAGDETLRFWNVFPANGTSKSKKKRLKGTELR